MAIFFPDLENIQRLTTAPTEGESYLLSFLGQSLDDDHEVFFNPFLDGDRPDIIILKRGCGAAIIEVKDWSLAHYRVDAHNRWRYEDSYKLAPQQQAFRYKRNLFDLHLPILGLKECTNAAFFRVISAHVYFHNASRKQLERFYAPAEEELRALMSALNRNRSTLTEDAYAREFERIARTQRNLARDLAMSWTPDRLAAKIRKLSTSKEDILFSDDIYEEFKRRLAPPIHVLRQGRPVPFDSKQLPLTGSTPGLSKIKGVAGSGKTAIMAQRAINARARHGGDVLLLSFNITLRHFIRDTISRQQGQGADNHYVTTHFHGLVVTQLNELGIDDAERPDLVHRDAKGVERLAVLLDSDLVTKFKTILIDETQDFEPEWIKLVHDRFLDENGEMVLFADESQNIYQREGSLREPPMVRGFGRWQKLTRSYRSGVDSRLVTMFKRFHEQYLAPYHPDAETFDCAPTQRALVFDLLSYESYGPSYDPTFVCNRVREYIKVRSMHPNDVSIICSQIDYLVPINERLRTTEDTRIMFETSGERENLEELEQRRVLSPEEKREKIEKIRRVRKHFFFQNSGLLKLSTTHSFMRVRDLVDGLEASVEHSR